MHLVNSFNAGTTNDFITPTDSADSGDPVASAGPSCQYAYQDGHYCVGCYSTSDGLNWLTGNQAAWHPGYYIRFDLFIEAGQPTWGLQDIAVVFLYDGVDNSHGASWLHKLVATDDGYLWMEDINATQTINLGIGAIRFGEWNTVTIAQDIAAGKVRLSIRHKDGSTTGGGEVNFPSRSVGLYSVDLGRLNTYGSGGTAVYIDNLRGYNTPYGSEPTPRDPRDGTDPETPGPNPNPRDNDPDPSPVLDPDDPAWDPVITPDPPPPDPDNGPFPPGPYPDDPYTPPTPPGVIVRNPPPGTGETYTFDDPEILYSTVLFTQRGIELGVNQGVVPAGTVMAKNSTNRRWYAYSNAGTDGLNVARGILRRSVDTDIRTDNGPQLGNLVIQGLVKLDAIHGLDGAALTDLGATVNDVRGFLRF